MRIAVVNNFFPPRVGGSSHLSEALAKGYAAAGHEVLVLTAAYADAPEVEERDGLRIVRVPAAMIPKSRLSVSFDIAFTMRSGAYRRVSRLLGEFQPNVIHQHGQFFDLTWMSGIWGRRHNVPALLSIHTRLENPAAAYHGVFRGLDAVVVKPIIKAYRPRMVVMDAQMQDYIVGRYSGAYSALENIPVGVDTEWVTGGDGRRVRQKHDLGDLPLIVSLGHVIPLRDRLLLVQALPRVLDRHPHAKLLVVGQVYFDAFLELARELGVSHAVMAIGPVPKSEVPDYLAAADVETHDLQGYGLGTASLESMAAGVPMVVAVRPDNFPGIELRSGENVVLTPIDDAASLGTTLADLLDDPQWRARIGAAEQKLVRERFSMETVLSQHLVVLESMVAGGR
ncbi:MAG: glycosyltransferase family 4 protein [Terracoccus sp.]